MRRLLYNLFKGGNSIVNRIIDYLYNKLILLFIPIRGINNTIRKFNYIQDPSKIKLGSGVFIDRGLNISSENKNGSIIIGNNVHIGKNVSIDISGEIIIEDDVLISQDVVIYTHSHGHNPHNSPTWSSLKIGKGTWIGAKSVILPNVTEIGQSSIVGLGVVVSKDIENNSIVVGNPNRILK